MCPTLPYLRGHDYIFEDIKPHAPTYLTSLESNFKNRFPEPTVQQHEWMGNPFPDTIGEKVSHISLEAEEFSYDTSLKIKFEALSLFEFRVYVYREVLGNVTVATIKSK
jgi:hypothetical protein